MQKIIKEKPQLYGLVMIGGESKRMQKNKALLNYHGQAQYRFCYELLEKYCVKTFLSVQNNATAARYGTFPKIRDLKNLAGHGPLTGIVSAFRKYPNVSWIVLACDLPFVNGETIEYLLKKRDPKKDATAFKSNYDSLPEPLCAVYEPKIQKLFEKYIKDGSCCPRKVLINARTKLILAGEKHWLDNVNTPEEYKDARQKIKK